MRKPLLGCFRRRRKKEIERDREENRPRPAPGPPPPQPPISIDCPQGFWSHDREEDAGLDQIPLMAALLPDKRIFWQKQRYPLYDPGPGWFICVEYAWDKHAPWEENIIRIADFFIGCQGLYGSRVIAGTIWDEPDMAEDYDPDVVDGRIQGIREKMSEKGSPLFFPIGPNMACATGMPNLGIEQIRAKGLPISAGIIWLEGYPMIAGNYEPYVEPAVVEACHRLHPGQRIGYVCGVWQPDAGQPEPGREEVMVHWRTWNEGALARWADRVVTWIYYRWRTDPGAGDCHKGIDQLPEAQAAIKEIADQTGWRVAT